MSQTISAICDTCETFLWIGQRTRKANARPINIYDMHGQRSLHDFIDDHLHCSVRFVCDDTYDGDELLTFTDEDTFHVWCYVHDKNLFACMRCDMRETLPERELSTTAQLRAARGVCPGAES